MILGNDIFLMGKSFGSAVATYTMTELSSRDGHSCKTIFKGLILECGFTSAQACIAHLTSGYLLKTFYSDIKWPTIERIENVQVPTLILHGDAD